MPNPPPFSSSVRVGEPRLANDPLSIEDQLVWLLMDKHIRSFVEPKYGDAFPNGGYVDPTTGATLYSDYFVIDTKEPDRQFIDVCYRKLPGAILSGSKTDDSSGIVTNFTKQMVKSGTVTGGIVGSVVTGLTLNTGGTNYTAGTYNLVFTGGGGTGAAGTYTVTGPSPAGKIGSVDLTASGSGFTSIPSAAISGGGGSGATVSVQLNGKPIVSVALTSTDSGFTATPAVTITDTAGTGSGATATALLTGTTVASATVTAGGSGYSGSPSATISGGGGTGATATVTAVAGVVTAVNITAAGSGYTSTPTIVITDSTGTGATASIVLTGTSIASLSLTNSGNFYQSPTLTISGAGNATGTATISPTTVKSITLTAAGSGYTGPSLSITGGGGTGATGTATLATGTITSVSLTNPGSNYTSAPTVTAPTGGGIGANISAVIGSTTYVDVEPLTAGQDLVMRMSINEATIPPARAFQVTHRVRFKDVSVAEFVYVFAGDEIDLGMNESTTIGGSGPVFAVKYERYLTTSQYEAYSSSFGLSLTGAGTAYTLTYLAISGGHPRVFTFRPTPWVTGTGAGVVDMESEKQRLGIYKLTEIVLTQNY